jgi:cell division protein FtsL
VSLPAQRVDPSSEQPVPAARPRTPPPPHARRRARRGSPPLFWLLAVSIVSVLLVGIVSLSAMMVQASIRTTSVEDRIATLTDLAERRDTEVARLSSPSRIGAWAKRQGMVPPRSVVILPVEEPEGGS